MLKYKVLLFDLDGTLCNTDEMIVQSFFSLYKEFEPIKLRTREEIYYFSGPPIKETLKNDDSLNTIKKHCGNQFQFTIAFRTLFKRIDLSSNCPAALWAFYIIILKAWIRLNNI